MNVLFAAGTALEAPLIQCSHHFARLLAGDRHDVLWVNTVISVKQLARRSAADKYLIRKWLAGVEPEQLGMKAVTPFALLPYVNYPVFRSGWVGRHSLQLTVPRLSSRLRRAGAGAPELIWLATPELLSILGCVKPAKCVAYSMSDLNTAFSTSPKSFEGLEAETCRRAHVVFATAQTLVRRAGRWADNVVYLPNGVDLETFTGDFAEPDDLKPISRPRLIYVGSFSDWVDYDMYEHIARERPDASLVLIGPISGTIAVRGKTKRRLDELSRLPNVHYLGPRPQLEMRHYLAHSDVALIPFISSQLTHAVSPVKLFEYGAAGLPVVARDLEETRLNAGATLFYNTPAECIDSIERALAEKEWRGTEMREFAEQNTWHKRYASVRRAFTDLGLTM